ncbi:nucleoside hydrolase [Aureimonas sp. AU4]|uniref:nucleoside hydrolase n=1 Tax=Aureimonas sp. AU4 TaxID=1638163 RepID=UPI000781D622|nr:nucleoside hydrolase [Aureimonas sp. AU4]
MTDAPSSALVVDTDGGVDDAQALLMLLGAGRVPALVTTVFGNVALKAATRNVLATLASGGAGHVPVHPGAARPLLAPRIEARHIHGEDGLGGAPRPQNHAPAREEGAVDALRALLRKAAPASVDLLFLGPLTNLAILLSLDPGVAHAVRRLVIMGGTLEGRGNTTPAAEFNIASDPEAARIVLTSGLPIELVPWEPCRRHVMTGDEIEAVFAGASDTEGRRFSEALALHARRTNASYGAGDVFRFVDPLAAALLLEPAIARRTSRASLDVVLGEGPGRGMVLVDPSGRLGTPEVLLLEEADPARLRALFAASVDPAANG